jgi:predicted histone-like DNA-binding protein
VLNLLQQVMIEEVAEGNIIRLGEFGSFSVSIKGEGGAKAEEVTAANVTGASLNFRPGEDLTNLMQTLKYEKMAS